MHVLVIGPGALGQTYGLLLEKSGHSVYFQSRQVQTNTEKPLTVHFPEFKRTETIKNPKIHPEPSQFFSAPALDLIIISIKTTENHLLKTLLSKHTLSPNTIIFIPQNGIGNEEYVANLLPNSPIVAGVTDIAAVREDTHTVTVKRLGLLKLAPFKSQDAAALTQIENAFSTSPVQVNISKRDNHKQIRWEKLLWNIPFNSLCTLCRMPASHLLLNDESKAFVQHLMLEIIHIAKSDGVEIKPSAIDTLFEATIALGEYRPSMYTHFLNNQAIESEYIIKNALRIAEKNQVDTPRLKFINQCIHTHPLMRLHELNLNSHQKVDKSA